MIPKIVEQYGMCVTINTTEDCNLRCKYCYEINKKKKYLTTENAYRFIDIIIEEDNPLGKDDDIADSASLVNIEKDGIKLDFIGGDALMDVDQVDSIMEYFIYKLNTSNSENARNWRGNWLFSISSNGTLFEDPKVRAFCEKWKDVLSLGVSIDGCPEIHDKYRVFPDNVTGSMSTIQKWWPWYRKTFPASSNMTKATCSKDSIYYLYDSLKFIHEDLGISQVLMNFIMEDAHLEDKDYIELDNQLRKCVPYVLDHRDNLYWDIFSRSYAEHHLSTGSDWTSKGHCGSGAMPCLGIDGNIYPCFRWLPHTQTSYASPIIVGNLTDGLNNKDGFKRVRQGACRQNCSQEKCKTCEYESACPYCIAGCYSEFHEFRRTVYICDIVKILCKWAKVYWNEYSILEGKPLEFDEYFTLKNIKEWTPNEV